MSNKFAELLKLNVNDHTERKSNLTYLSWAWAWAEALKADPDADFTVHEYGPEEARVPYMTINDTAMVKVTVKLHSKERTCQLPVMDHRNKAIKNPDAFAVNTAIMRCMTKALSLHGLGLYIYAGEDLPEGEEPEKPVKAVKITPIQGAAERIEAQDRESIDALAQDVIEAAREGDAQHAAAMCSDVTDADQKVYLWSLLPSDVRSAIKKVSQPAKEAA